MHNNIGVEIECICECVKVIRIKWYAHIKLTEICSFIHFTQDGVSLLCVESDGLSMSLRRKKKKKRKIKRNSFLFSEKISHWHILFHVLLKWNKTNLFVFTIAGAVKHEKKRKTLTFIWVIPNKKRNNFFFFWFYLVTFYRLSFIRFCLTLHLLSSLLFSYYQFIENIEKKNESFLFL